MATSDAMPRRPKRFHCAVPCLLLCAALLGPFDALHELSFAQGVAWDGTRAAQRQVAQRFSRQREPTRGEPDADGKVEAKRLTSSIKKAYSAEKLIEVLDGAVDGPIFNFFHVSATYTQLVTLKRRKGLQQREWDSQTLRTLHARVEDMVLKDQVDPQGVANILWSMATLAERVSIPTQLLAALVKSVPTKVKDMKPQGIYNIFWASAKAKDVAPVMLEMVPAIVAQIPKKAKDMNEQGVSNSLWASAQLKEVAPDVVEAVPAIVAQIFERAKDMIPQQLSNCLWASGQLKDVAPEVLQAVPAIAAQIPGKARDMIPQHLSNCLWASAQLKDEVPEVLEIIPAIVGEISLKINDMVPQALANSVEALILLRDSVPEVEGFLAAGGDMDGILRSAAARLNTLLPGLKGKDLSFAMPVVVWACAKAEVSDGELLASVARRLGSRSKLGALQGFNLCALSWAYQVLDTDAFDGFKRLLMSETEKRGFSEADVKSCQRGRSGWNYR